ncbi:MAG TPA: hypothetical protein VFJ20_02165 [Gemmatimonadaceae bacterium]|nr:hypothetical protein [Gemmatimonadaceae bacterium]
MDSTRAARLGLTVVLAFYGFRLLLHPDAGSLMDSVDLPIHETGHLVFAPFGEFLQFLGGTLFQLIMPSVFVGYFLMRKDRHAASCMVWWVGQNCWNISVYVRDARAQVLPLVGGGEHDWAYLLGEYGWLPYDQRIGHAVWWAGVLLYVLAIGGGLLTLVGTPVSTEEPVELAAD